MSVASASRHALHLCPLCGLDAYYPLSSKWPHVPALRCPSHLPSKTCVTRKRDSCVKKRKDRACHSVAVGRCALRVNLSGQPSPSSTRAPCRGHRGGLSARYCVRPTDLLQTVILSVSARSCPFLSGSLCLPLDGVSATIWIKKGVFIRRKLWAVKDLDTFTVTGAFGCALRWTFERFKLSTRRRHGICMERKESSVLTCLRNMHCQRLLLRKKIKCSKIW